MNAGVDTVAGVSLPAAWIVKIDGTRTFLAPAVAAAPVVSGGVAVVAVCEGAVVVVAGVAEELVLAELGVLDVVPECFDPPQPPSSRRAGASTKRVRERLIL
jgi:hypothetical protein